jgi:hypothetical protein
MLFLQGGYSAQGNGAGALKGKNMLAAVFARHDETNTYF